MTPALQDLISPDVGVVSVVSDGTACWPGPRLHAAYATVCHTDELLGCTLDARAGGLALSRADARAAALGEALERYSASCVPRSRLRWASRAQLPGAVEIIGSAPAGDGNQHWAPGWCLTEPGPAWLPANRVYLSDIDSELDTGPTTSTGLACHPQPWRALRSALYEVIERDAVMVSWLGRQPGRLVQWSPEAVRASPLLTGLALAPETYRQYLLDSPTGVPVVFTVAFGAADQPGAAVGAAANLDVGRAALRSATEAVQTMNWATAILSETRSADDGRPASPLPKAPPLPTASPCLSAAEVRDLEDHVRYYLDPARRAAFDFLADDGRPPMLVPDPSQAAEDTAAEDAAADVHRVIAALASAGMTGYACDVTSPELRQCGCWVVRAIVPQLYPLEVSHPGDHRNHPRIARFQRCNPDPHPFP